MANAYNYSNTAQQTTLTGNISNTATTLTVAATTGFPGTTPYVLAVDYGAATEELIVVTNVAGTTLTVTRGFSGTSAQSHSIGAVVRHVVTAQDLIDFRTHEAATSNVHGVTGALVGATQTQTLTNKTLTSPTINGATLSGTFAGNATFSGEIIHTNLYRGSRGLATDSQWESRVTGDANARFFIRADGRMCWGAGTTAFDAVIYRDAVNSLTTDDQFRSARASGTEVTWISQRSADTGARWYMTADGVATWGDGAGSMDTNLYRSASDTLKTDDALTVGGELSVLGGTTWTPYTPSWTNVGSATFTTNTGYYWKLGKIVFVSGYAVVNAAGSGTSVVNVTMPSTVDKSTRQVLTFHGETIGVNGGGTNTFRGGEVTFVVGANNATADRIRVDDNDGDGEQNLQGQDLKAGSQLAFQGWYREA
jgi:hypothetical protein